LGVAAKNRRQFIVIELSDASKASLRSGRRSTGIRILVVHGIELLTL
jgi:hypothetical protein